ncbi:ComEC family competence protein [Delftia tsuruhatensis]|uniref:DNA internalization-related competence protein ComEC/Rec2 n=1 Tax=Delftia tsuruhatensis TaxID=180282 RepID=UPI001E7676B6|nr:DNA internalization-related competence protein ComEC/Rec2 [Delftia tsuruhatensis]CAB5658543.1 ComEC family competence protein [Delftia tsuruhatensis]CAC9679454.1 ComEC family competence protein [Delftia tsuruhatensis]
MHAASPGGSGRHPHSWTPLLLGCVAGAAWQVTQPQLWALWSYLVLLALGGLSCAWGLRIGRGRGRGRAQGLAPQLWGAACAALLVAGLTGWRAQEFSGRALAQPLEGRDLRIVGVVASLPQRQAQGTRWRMAVERASLAGSEEGLAPFPVLIELSWYATATGGRRAEAWAQPADLRPGQRWEMTVRLKRPHGARNPHGFDYELWQWEQGVQATGHVRAQASARFLGETASYGLQRWRQQMRDAIVGPDPQAAPAPRWPAADPGQLERMRGVVAALAMGDQQAIARDDWTLFRHTGVAHLMSISGLHITLFSWLAALAVGRLWRCSARACLWCPAPHAALVAGVLLAGGYALFSGWGLPAQRTVCMLAAVATLRAAGLRWPWPAVWCLALAVVVVIDPWALWQAGFWLSFVAVGVLLATDARRRDRPRPSLPARALASWGEQWRISLALAPLGLMLFGQLSLAGLAANLLAIPWVTFVITPLALLGVLWAPLWTAAAWALAPLMAFLQWLQQWDWAVLQLPQPPLWAGLAALAGGLALVAPLPSGWRAWGLAMCLPALWWPSPAPAHGEFELLAVDIGQGHAVLLRTARHSLLYDTGPPYGPDSDAGGRVLVPLLQSLGLRLDALWLSHRDSDHTGGALSVHAAQPQAGVWGSDSVILDEALAGLGPVHRCQAGQRWEWDGVQLEVLHPPATRVPPAQEALARANAGSCVLLVRSSSGAAALLAGDIEAAQERVLAQAGTLPPVDWLLVPHHGSRTSSSTALVQALLPRWAVVQAGYRSRYGHPVPEVVRRYESAGSTVVQSSRCGAAHWRSGAPAELVCERVRERRYWDVHVAGEPASGTRPAPR